MPNISDLIQDPQAGLVKEQFALVYTPRRQRNRFPDNCVHVVESEQAARAGADPAKNLHPAKVIGPSRSSEGFMLYYLVAWLE